ncbi:hypothetical protein ABEB36_002761 [Hypothenemus hampei]|uniref:Ferritin n=1 Tax=Hypothenemus hampei TaxID=57062 RepID=A0ABD1F6Z9_HYPHA
MKVVLAVFAAILAVASAAEECYTDVVETCNNPSLKQEGVLTKCDAQYGGIVSAESDLQKLANSLIHRSFDFLLMATHYGNYIKNRPGFEKLFRGLSDDLWEDGIESVKYITSRGGQMNFKNVHESLAADAGSLELYELHSMSKALDIEKSLAKQVFDLHKETANHRVDHYDPEIGHHLEEKFMGKQKETIRKLAGHAKDLGNLLNEERDPSLALYLFDQYLQK